MKKLEEIGAKVISAITIGGQFGWPPDCYGIYYQPERPVQTNKPQIADEMGSVTKKAE